MDLEKVLACRVCGYPFVLYLRDGRTRKQDPELLAKRVSCPDCDRTYHRGQEDDAYHLEGDPTARLDVLEASEWGRRWQRPPRVLLDTVDDYGRHVWLRISTSFIRVLEQRPDEALALLASQRPGAFDPDRVRFVCWHHDDYGPGGYRIAEVLLPA